MNPRLKNFILFGVAPFLTAALVGAIVPLFSPVYGGIIMRGAFDTLNHLLAPLYLIILIVLIVTYFNVKDPKVRRYIGIFWKIFLAVVLAIVGYAVGFIPVNLHLAKLTGIR
jgi:ABC-type dipeptide/oligopeptide/nickel transport system permease subunit